MDRSVILAARRSPIGRYLGSLSRMTGPQLGTVVAQAALADAGTGATDIDEVFVGSVLQAGLGQNPARQIALAAGLDQGVTAVTLNKVCGSGMESIIQADRAIRCGDIKTALCGGIESMSQVPYFVRGARAGLKFGDTTFIDGMQSDGLTCPFENWAMGCAAEHIAQTFGITRAMQDEYAVRSHQMAAQAQADNAFDGEIVPIDLGRKGTLSADETVRKDATVEQVGKLPTVFDKNGTVTAANASALSDGAAMVVVAGEQTAAQHNWKPLARVLATTTHGVAPKELFSAPVDAIRTVVDKAGLKLENIDLFELNEAFAAQVLANLKVLEIPENKVNVHGGAISLGHPIGASGTRVVVTLLHAMAQRNAKHGVAALCLGGGNAVAVCVERL